MTNAKTSPPALVVGTGFGCRIHVPALRAAGFEVAGLVGTDMARTARRANNIGVSQSFVDLDEAMARTHAVAVSIATPPNTHKSLVMAALSRDCHIICEKPFAMNTAEARKMLDAARRACVVHFVGHEFRWTPDRALAARAVADGMIGEPRLLTLTQYHSLVASSDAKMPRWWFDEQSGGGWLGASGSHIIDQVRSWLGEFASLSAALPVVSDREAVAEDTYVVRFRLANGAEGTIQQTAGAWGPAAAMSRVAGTKGSLWIENGAVWLADRDGSRMLSVPADLELPPPPSESDDPRHRFSHIELGPYTRLCEAFRSAIDGKLSSAVAPATFADGLAEMEVLDAIRASSAKGGALIAVAQS